jgi:hypothetical protein
LRISNPKRLVVTAPKGLQLAVIAALIAAATAGKALVDDDCAKKAVAELTRASLATCQECLEQLGHPRRLDGVQRVAQSIDPHVRHVAQQTEAQRQVTVAQRIAEARIGLHQEHRACDRRQQLLRLIALEHDARSDEYRRQHVRIELMHSVFWARCAGCSVAWSLIDSGASPTISAHTSSGCWAASMTPTSPPSECPYTTAGSSG